MLTLRSRFPTSPWRRISSSGGLGLALGLFALTLCGAASVEPAAANPTLTTLYRFQGLPHGDGSEPVGALARDRAGVIYGTTFYGGLSSSFCGTSNLKSPIWVEFQ